MYLIQNYVVFTQRIIVLVDFKKKYFFSDHFDKRLI